MGSKSHPTWASFYKRGAATARTSNVFWKRQGVRTLRGLNQHVHQENVQNQSECPNRPPKIVQVWGIEVTLSPHKSLWFVHFANIRYAGPLELANKKGAVDAILDRISGAIRNIQDNKYDCTYKNKKKNKKATMDFRLKLGRTTTENNLWFDDYTETDHGGA